MDVVSRLRNWIGADEEDAPYVCINCGVDYERNYRECPECGKPYVTAKTGDAEGSDR